MQDNSGNITPLTNFKKEFLDSLKPADPDPFGWKPVMEQPDGTMAEPQGKSKAEMNQAMKDAGWTRAERRRYLSNKKENQNG